MPLNVGERAVERQAHSRPHPACNASSGLVHHPLYLDRDPQIIMPMYKQRASARNPCRSAPLRNNSLVLVPWRTRSESTGRLLRGLGKAPPPRQRSRARRLGSLPNTVPVRALGRWRQVRCHGLAPPFAWAHKPKNRTSVYNSNHVF